MSELDLNPARGSVQPQRTAPFIDRDALVELYLQNRRTTQWLFDLLHPDAYYERPIALRQPVVFYEGHLAGFAVNILLKGALGRAGIDESLELLFARGIDPDSPQDVTQQSWPSREVVSDYVTAATDAVVDALRHEDFGSVTDPENRRLMAAWTIVEHDPMHHETLLYMWHQLDPALKRRPAELRPSPSEPGSLGNTTVDVPHGLATLGADRRELRFGWDNEFPSEQVAVPSFQIDRYNVTNGDFLKFVEAGGYQNSALWTDSEWRWLNDSEKRHPTFWVDRGGQWYWRGMFEEVPLPSTWPVWVSQAEATAYARWSGRRLPTEAEFHRAAFGTPEGGENLFPWGNARPEPRHGNFDLQRLDPVPVGSYPDGVSAWGIHDLIGNGWEWTSTIFAPFKGFAPMITYPVYSTDFFDDMHFVLKGASPATSVLHIRRSFRNWFRPNYPYVYAGFRTVAM
ncbi:MAG TPA: SUMF1/EgtB/PvdO family nonheme iron enzyme [Thermoanaerobaculia bacterium]|nr:SUMF1/EgtB/PvdO family nonheme iron enzyme [Thermoanaerobaculia bacterium]